MNPPSLRTARTLVAGGLLLGLLSGCGMPETMHHSGQIGRFYGEGVSFSVPQVAFGEGGKEDRYWELRRGIDKTVVVAFSPLLEGDNFRENLVVTSQDLDRTMSPEAFRAAQLQQMKAEGDLVGEPTLGGDTNRPWAEFSRQEGQATVHCVAWFFTRPAEGDLPARGWVLLGTAAEGATLETYRKQFEHIASTFRFGRPPTGFALLGDAVDQVAEAAVGPAAAPTLSPAAPAPSPEASPDASAPAPAPSPEAATPAPAASPAASPSP